MNSRELLHATPVSHDQSEFTGYIIQETPFYGGGHEPGKKLLQIEIGGVATTFVEREYTSYHEEGWRGFREAGLPVAPTLHRSSRGTLLVADVKADRSEVYGKSFFYSVGDPHDEFRRSPEADAHFLELMAHNREAIHEAAVSLAETATRHTIRLPRDDPLDLRVQPNGAWSLISLDLEGAVVPANLHGSAERFNGEVPNPARFRDENMQYVEYWEGQLVSIQRLLEQSS